MTLRELRDTLNTYGEALDLEVEVATSDRKDEWYELVEVEVTTNFRGQSVFVLHTD